MEVLQDRPLGQKLPLQGGSPSNSYITYYWKPPEILRADKPFLATTLLESRNMIEAGTTGLRTWTAAFFLAQYLLHNPDIVLQKRVLELGSGIGFTGIIIGTIQVLSQAQGVGRPRLWLTDIDETVLSVCRRNVDLSSNLSSLHGNIRIARIDWFDALNETSAPNLSFSIREQMDPELIIGSDIVFDPSLIPPLLSTLNLAIRNSSRTALLALTMRNETTMSTFLSSARSMGFTVEDLTPPMGTMIAEGLFLPNIVEDMERVKLLQFSMDFASREL